MDDKLATAALIWIAFTTIAALTWYFSARLRLVVSVFCPPEERRGLYRRLLGSTNTKQAMRVIAILQFAAGIFAGVVAMLLP